MGRCGSSSNRKISDEKSFETKNKFQKFLFCKNLLSILTVGRCGNNSNRKTFDENALTKQKQVFESSCFVKTCLAYWRWGVVAAAATATNRMTFLLKQKQVFESSCFVKTCLAYWLWDVAATTATAMHLITIRLKQKKQVSGSSCFVKTCLPYWLWGVAATIATATRLIKMRLKQKTSLQKFLFCKHLLSILTVGRCGNNSSRNKSDTNAFGNEQQVLKSSCFVQTCLAYWLWGVATTTATATNLIKMRLETKTSVQKFWFCKNLLSLLAVGRCGNNSNRNKSDKNAFETKNKCSKVLVL